METLLQRFCRYVRIDTAAVETSTTYPSSPGQTDLARILSDELRASGVGDVSVDKHSIVLATIKSNLGRPAPTIAWIAHMDTSPETSGHGVKPMVLRNYAGQDLVLPGNTAKVLRPADDADLAAMKGKTLITTDGTTLLGADDKAGIAIIMEAAGHLVAHPEIKHGDIRICFTCDEEIGRGVDHLDLKKLGAVAAYTLDGGGQGEIDCETFSADLAVVAINGVNIHPGLATGKMVNAVRLAADFVHLLPAKLSPEMTRDREGFLHPYRIEGGVAQTTMRILLRDFDTARLADHAKHLENIAARIRAEHPQATVDVKITPQYRNMAEGMAKEPRALAYAEKAMRRAGLQPKMTIVRGGTDGSRLTEMGLPTPNLSAGEHNIHSPLEWTCLEEMATAVRVLVELAQTWAEDK
jgi:tripeptide aminopeptidase